MKWIAALVRALVGIAMLSFPLLFLPIHKITPILTGAGVLMAVHGTSAVWTLGRAMPHRRSAIGRAVWVLGILILLPFLLMVLFGPGAFAPSWEDLAPKRAPAQFEAPLPQ